jgi:ABC-type nitrate/sulfonate/bicarbonate transport system substrate-binding protein
LLGPRAFAADKIAAGTLGGQAPLWPFYIADHKGFFAAEGLDVEINFAQSGAAVTQQLTAGSIDVALSVGINDPIHAIDKGAPLALVRIIGDAAPYVLIGKPGLKNIAELRGKTVSVGAANDMTTIYFELMAAANGLKRGDYDMLSAGVAAARYAALKAGVVDAALVLPPLNFAAAKSGYVTLGLAADYVKDLPFTGMAVFRPWANSHAPLVKRILAATDRSVAPIRATAMRRSRFWSTSLMPAARTPRPVTICCAASNISSPAAVCRAPSCRISSTRSDAPATSLPHSRSSD